MAPAPSSPVITGNHTVHITRRTTDVLSDEGVGDTLVSVACGDALECPHHLSRPHMSSNEERRDRDLLDAVVGKSDQEFRLLVDIIPALVWRGTAEGDLEYLNRHA